jgi:hypothetical protein
MFYGFVVLGFLLGSPVVGAGAEAPISSGDVVAETNRASAKIPGKVARPSQLRPSVIYVTDFHLDPTQVEERKKLVGREDGGIVRGRGPLGGRLTGAKESDPEAEARKLVSALTDSIVKHLNSEGLRAERLANVSVGYSPSQGGSKMQIVPSASKLPKQGWLLAGWFEQVEEGKAGVKATVGFGAGSGHASADVAVSDLASDPAQAFLVMGSGSRTKHMPGGVVTKNPYVMAAKFVINKRQGMEKDVKNLGAQIAKSLKDYVDELGKTGTGTK